MKIYVTCPHGVSQDRRCSKCEAERDELVQGLGLGEK